MERSGVLPTTQFAYRKGLGTCDALLCISHTLQSVLESGQEARIMQIDFRAAFDRVNLQGILYGLSLWVLEVLCYQYTVSINRSQCIIVGGCWSKLVDVVSGVPQDRVWGRLLFILAVHVLEIKLIGYAAGSTLTQLNIIAVSGGSRETKAAIRVLRQHLPPWLWLC